MPVSPVTTLPLVSSTETLGWVAKLFPAVTPPTGWVVKASLVAVPELMTTLVEVATLSEAWVALSV